MDVKQQSAATRGGSPDSNPMNLTCKPTVSVEAMADVDGDTLIGDSTTKYAIVMNGTGAAQAPNSSWTTTVFVSAVDYTIESHDGTVGFTIPAGGLGIYSK